MSQIPQPKNLPKNLLKSRRQEKRINDKVNKSTGGGRLTPGSGNKNEKGDVLNRGKIRIEAKTTANKSYPLKLADFNKVRQASLLNGELPCMEIEFTDSNSKELLSLCVVTSSDFYDMLERYCNED